MRLVGPAIDFLSANSGLLILRLIMAVPDQEIQVEYQSALVIFVPESEPLVDPFRSKYDPSATDGLPAHITINFPFLTIEKDESGAIESLRRLFLEYPSFRFSLVAVKRFPGVLYLEPFPGQPFSDLIQAVAQRFPQSPPYGGMFEVVVPHLTVAVFEDAEAIEGISQQLTVACIGKLPIQAAANEVWLVDNRQGRWTRRVSFALAEHV